MPAPSPKSLAMNLTLPEGPFPSQQSQSWPSSPGTSHNAHGSTGFHLSLSTNALSSLLFESTVFLAKASYTQAQSEWCICDWDPSPYNGFMGPFWPSEATFVNILGVFWGDNFLSQPFQWDPDLLSILPRYALVFLELPSALVWASWVLSSSIPRWRPDLFTCFLKSPLIYTRCHLTANAPFSIAITYIFV